MALPERETSMPLDPAHLDPTQIAKQLETFEVEQLAAIVSLANQQYWDEQAPTLPDPLYDQLVERLRVLDPAHSLLDEMGPNAVPPGDAQDAATLAKQPPESRFGSGVAHQRPMLSLEKCYEAEELRAWVEKRGGEVLVMPKMDGVAASLWYDPQGKLQVAATRGSGQVGEDITLRMRELPNLPALLEPAPGQAVEVRGEVYMRRSIFDTNYAHEYSHPRNLTAGSLKRKDAKEGARGEHLQFYAYDIEGPNFAHESEKLQALADFGFDSPDAQVISLDEVLQSVESHTQGRQARDYEVDGIVYRVADVAVYRELGATGHHPRGAIAYKFQGERAHSKLQEIEWSVSRTGAITPVAIFEAVQLDGASLTRASLHNLQRFEAMELNFGSLLVVTRRGGVIPMVERAIDPGDTSQPFESPSRCPACTQGVQRVQKRDGIFLFCADPSRCLAARMGELEHFAKVIDMMGFGPKFIELAFDAKLLRSIPDFFRLRAEDLEKLERVGAKTAQNLLAEVDKARKVDLATFLRCLGMPSLGKRNADRVALHFGTLAAVRAADQSALIAIEGFQETMAQAVLEGLRERSELIDELVAFMQVRDAAPEVDEAAAPELESPLSGRSVLFTGTLTQMPRNQAQDCLRKVGAQVASGVNQKLDLLVVGEGKGKISSKEKKARALQEEGAAIEIISEAEFWARMPAQFTSEA